MKKLAAIGMFDGVHLGHCSMLQDLRRRACERGMEPMVVTFVNHPLSVISRDSSPKMLMGSDERRRLLETECAGRGSVAMLEFTPEVRAMKAAEFMAMLRDQYDVGAIYLGYNHRFGSDRLTDFEAYRREAAAIGIEVMLGVEERGPEGCRISSSEIRRALTDGDIVHANEMLGRRYRVVGRVVAGQQLGRTIGFPTANIDLLEPGILVPASGVYAAWVAVAPGGTRHKAVVNIGFRPTVGEAASRETIEAYLLDFSGDLYGATVEVEFCRRLRDEKRFESLDALRSAIEGDVVAAREIL